MSAIGPGDWVECTADTDSAEVVARGIYCVEVIIDDGGICHICDESHPGLIFKGHKKLYTPIGEIRSWCPCRFRPIYRPKADLIESLKAPPVRVGEFA